MCVEQWGWVVGQAPSVMLLFCICLAVLRRLLPSVRCADQRCVACCVVAVCVGEEVTYDYRFAGEEKLRCNCGAPSCRGWVNMPSSIESPRRPADGSMVVLRQQLVFVKGAGNTAAAAPGSRKKLQL